MSRAPRMRGRDPRPRGRGSAAGRRRADPARRGARLRELVATFPA